MQLDQLNGLVALKVVAETRNFTAAARVFGVSPSAVSQTIKQLELRLGATLLSRTTRSTSLTEAGEIFLNQAGPALDQILLALDNLGANANRPSGLLRLNLPRHVYAFYLAPYIASFMKKYPDIHVELFLEDQQSDVVAKGFDAGIRLSDLLAKDVVAVKLFGPVRFLTAAAPKYLDRVGRPKHPKDLLTHDCICPRLGESVYDRWEFESKGREFQVHVKQSLIINDTYMMLDVAADGMGVVYGTDIAVRDRVRRGELEIVLEQYAASSSGFYLYYPKQSQVLPKLRAFIEHIKRRPSANKTQSSPD